MDQPQLELDIPKVEKKSRESVVYRHGCETCNKEFESHRRHARFCSDKCRSINTRKRHKLNGIMTTTKEEQTKPPKVNGSSNGSSHGTAVVATPIFQGLTPQMQIAVDLLKQDARRWEEMYREEKAARKKTEDSLKEKVDELARIKVDHQIESIENKRPSGLQGLAESPIVAKLLDHVGPALGALMMKLTDGSGPGLIGTDGQLDELTQTQISEFNKWFAGLHPDQRGVIYEIIVSWAQSKTPEILNDTLVRIKNILRSGTVIMPHVGYGNI